MSYYTSGGPDNKNRTNKPPSTGRVQKTSNGDTKCPPTSQNLPHWHPFWLSNTRTTRRGAELEWLARGNPETNPITMIAKTVSHVARQSSWIPWPSCSPSGCPFPIMSLALSACESPQAVHFWVLIRRPLSGPGRGSPFLQQKEQIWSKSSDTQRGRCRLKSIFTTEKLSSVSFSRNFYDWEAASQVTLRELLWGGEGRSQVI